ncbi:carboxypeptidase regulatory-like domain-containing protein [Belliella sp. DSM 107340]|uniref:Carboxypeptidase regulatory-like domain-containing protein n=1 Tax=Belliella calami TaxID=2923436 RepID=A0ABS9UMJ8_9BACT|nr:carboxypeptidase regulatory-like domain-containing protein [Belliella calami]MCH7397420.1 carboxypeptidase regulatory-like domain-containing protein [Belliella calami]
MRQSLLKSLFAFALVVFAIGTALGQVTTSSIQGIVSDASGETLPGANVVAVHEPSGTRYGAVTNLEGRFSLPNLRIGGPYTIQISFIGFRTQSYTGIVLKLGEPYSLTVNLDDDSEDLSEIIVTASRTGDFTSSRTGAATNISNEQVNSLPTINRSLTDFTRLTPQSNGNSFAGRDGRYNNVQIDGANFNNGFGLSDGLLPGGRSQPISLDAIQEITVNIAPYDVRQSQFTGAGVNAVTRSGTNQFEGSAFGFFRNQNYSGRRVGDLELDEQNQASTKIMGFRLGGPIIKNKLFFFVNAEQTINEGTNPGAVNLWRPSQDGIANPDNNISRTRESDLIAVRDHLINTWNYDPGRYQGYANDAGDKSTSIFARLDWNINEKHKFAARFSSVRGTRSSLVNGNSGPRPRSAVNRVSDQSIAFESTQYGTDDIVDSYAVELSSYFSPKLSNQFIGTYSKIQATRSTFSNRLFPTIDIYTDIVRDPVTGTPTTDGTNYITAGYDPFTFGNDVINNNFNIVNNLTYVEGKHEITAGVAFDSQTFGNQFLRIGASYYRYASVDDFLSTGTPNEVAPIMFGVTYPYEGADTYGGITLGQASIYLQDKISISPKFELTAGLRAEAPLFLNQLTTNQSIDDLEFRSIDGGTKNYKSGEWPKTRINLSPRVGFNYDVFGDGKLKLRGGTGIFYGNIPFVWFTNMPSGAGGYQNNVEPNSYGEISDWIGGIRFNEDPYFWPNNPPAGSEDVFLTSPQGGAPGTIALVDDEFKMPSVWRTSFGSDFQVPNTPITLTGDLMYTRDVNAVYQFLANRADATQFFNNGNDNREFYPGPGGAPRFNPAIGPNNVFILSNTQEKGNIVNATFGGTINSNRGLFGSLFYTYTYADEVSSNPGSSANSAFAGPNINNPNQQMLYNSFFAVPHRVVGSLSYKLNYLNHASTTFSIFYNGAHQGRFSYRYTNDINGDGINSDLLYVPANDSEINFADIVIDGQVRFTAAQQLEAFNEFVDNDPHLSKRRGQYAERNGNLIPWLNRFDIRILQDLYTNIGSRKNTLQLSLDIMNFGNMLNSDWGIATGFNNAQNLLVPAGIQQNGPSTFRMTTVTEDGQLALPKTPFRDITTIGTTWNMQIGLRYIF